ncbi:metal-dependent hydrolase [Mangrovimicrobium sediminis]|uniref:Metal-dependent hydrolase n=1 Tax=Mangrovimicrobium sediminis TaxID=2562682 RepID=A0A4Z0LZN2_9GAMM|nr:metal-dependent hydrolase [Haliea sp. SAOS-164]TGD72515.1 metal-dependent hydrolase [Haliea sp. SAOS-164]
MDPVTQAAVGAAAAQLGAPRRQYAKAAVIGALAGMAPDLDVLIRSSEDPLLALEFHRHFTHSLLFIPLLGGLCGLLLYALLGRRWQLPLRQVLLWSVLGYATHGLLDGCTSYGTQLLWPLSNHRFAWDIVSVIDPLFTVPLSIALVLAASRQSRPWLLAGVAWGALYLGVGVVQHERAVAIGEAIAAQRGHQPLKLEAKPSFGNLVVWKTVYATPERFYVDAVRPGLGTPRVWEGESIARLDQARDFPWLGDGDQQARDIARFDHFSAGYLGIDPINPLRVVDIRYSMLPHHVAPLWGIELSPQRGPEEHVSWYAQRTRGSEALRELLGMIFE